MDLKENNKQVNDSSYDSEDLEWYDPKAEYEEEMKSSIKMEKGDLLAIIIAGYKVMAPYILIILVMFFSLLFFIR